MPLQFNIPKLSGLYSVIINNTDSILYNNNIKNKSGLSLNSKIINRSNNKFNVYINSQYISANFKTPQYKYDSFYAFESNVSGSRIKNIDFNTLTLIHDDSNFMQFSQIFVPTFLDNNHHGFKWNDLTSYSTIIKSGDLDISLNQNLSTYVNYIQADLKTINIISNKIQIENISFNNLNSFYGTININPININNIDYSKNYNIYLYNNSNLQININGQFKYIYYNNIQNINLLFNKDIFNNTLTTEQIFNSNFYFSTIFNITNLFDCKYILNSNIIIKNSNINYRYLQNNYDTTKYNQYEFIILDYYYVLNNLNIYNNILLSTAISRCDNFI